MLLLKDSLAPWKVKVIYTLSIHIYSYICIDFSNEINNKDPKFKLVILLEY